MLAGRANRIEATVSRVDRRNERHSVTVRGAPRLATNTARKIVKAYEVLPFEVVVCYFILPPGTQKIRRPKDPSAHFPHSAVSLP